MVAYYKRIRIEVQSEGKQLIFFISPCLLFSLSKEVNITCSITQDAAFIIFYLFLNPFYKCYLITLAS